MLLAKPMVKLIKRIGNHEIIDRSELESILRKSAVDEDDVLAISKIVEDHFNIGSAHQKVLDMAEQLDTSIPHEEKETKRTKYPSLP